MGPVQGGFRTQPIVKSLPHQDEGDGGGKTEAQEDVETPLMVEVHEATKSRRRLDRLKSSTDRLLRRLDRLPRGIDCLEGSTNHREGSGGKLLLLDARGGKLLLLAGTDRLDTELTIGQMQELTLLCSVSSLLFSPINHCLHTAFSNRTPIVTPTNTMLRKSQHSLRKNQHSLRKNQHYVGLLDPSCGPPHRRKLQCL